MADSTKQQLAAERALAPEARNIDRHPPYLRIATEEAWNIPEILASQVRLLGSAGAPDDSSLRMAGMFSRMTALQEQLMDIGPRPCQPLRGISRTSIEGSAARWQDSRMRCGCTP